MIASNVVKKKVKFNPQKDEVHIYEKKDYVKMFAQVPNSLQGAQQVGQNH